MAKVEQLIPTQVQSGAEAAEMGRKGGIASGEARRAKRKLRDELTILLDNVITNHNTGEKATARKASMAALVGKMLTGDVAATKLAAQLLGELEETQGTTNNVTYVVKNDKELQKLKSMGDLE